MNRHRDLTHMLAVEKQALQRVRGLKKYNFTVKYSVAILSCNNKIQLSYNDGNPMLCEH